MLGGDFGIRIFLFLGIFCQELKAHCSSPWSPRHGLVSVLMQWDSQMEVPSSGINIYGVLPLEGP